MTLTDLSFDSRPDGVEAAPTGFLCGNFPSWESLEGFPVRLFLVRPFSFSLFSGSKIEDQVFYNST
jgi:hypothetical protein